MSAEIKVHENYVAPRVFPSTSCIKVFFEGYLSSSVIKRRTVLVFNFTPHALRWSHLVDGVSGDRVMGRMPTDQRTKATTSHSSCL
eukprot:314103-Amphidinium_carterae.1